MSFRNWFCSDAEVADEKPKGRQYHHAWIPRCPKCRKHAAKGDNLDKLCDECSPTSSKTFKRKEHDKFHQGPRPGRGRVFDKPKKRK